MSNRVMIQPQSRRSAQIEQEEKELNELIASAGKAPKEEEAPQEEEEIAVKEVKKPKVKEVKEEEEAKEGTEEESEELTSEEKTFKKRYGDLRRHAAQVEKDLREKIDKLSSKDASVVAPASDEDLDEWAKKYPDVASIVTTIADKKAKELFSKAEERLARLDEREAEADKRTAEQAIVAVHSDFIDLRESDEFHDWVDEQPKWVRDALYENEDDPQSVIRVLDLYKTDKGLTLKDIKRSQKDAAKAVANTNASEPDLGKGKTIRESDVHKMSDAEFEEAQAAISAAQQAGTFVYDMTGGAR